MDIRSYHLLLWKIFGTEARDRPCFSWLIFALRKSFSQAKSYPPIHFSANSVIRYVMLCARILCRVHVMLEEGNGDLSLFTVFCNLRKLRDERRGCAGAPPCSCFALVSLHLSISFLPTILLWRTCQVASLQNPQAVLRRQAKRKELRPSAPQVPSLALY